jgi:iron complex outermembrane receptor protein
LNRATPFLWLAALSTSNLLAQTPLPEVRESVIVTGTVDPVPLEEADRSIVQLPVRGQAILFNTFVDLLKLDPSLDLRQRGQNTIQGDLSIRGSTFGQTLVLVNGRRMNDPQSGHHHLDLPVPLQAIERIEVLRGAGSTFYGSDAVGGVVNFITKPAEINELRARAGLGSFGTNQESLAWSALRKSWSQQLSVARELSTGFKDNRDYRALAISSATRLGSRLGSTDLDLGYSDKPFGAQDFYGAYPSWERTKSWMASLGQGIGEKTSAAFTYRRHTDLFYLFRDNPQRYQNHHIAQSWQASLRRREPLRNTATFSYGAEAMGEDINSSNLGLHSRARGAAYATLDMRVLKRFSFTAGVRDEVVKGMPGEISPSLAAGYWVSSKLKLRASASRAFRLPTFTDLYYSDPANKGNPALRPESAWSYEGGADLRPSGAWRLSAAVFHRREKDGIDYAKSRPLDPWQAMNINRLQFTGVEASAGWRWRTQVFDWSYTGLRGVADPQPGMVSKYVLNYPIHSGVFGWTGSFGGVVARTRVGALERRDRSPYGIWDTSLAWTRGPVRPYFQASNLANTRYQEIPGVAMPGRAFLGGLEFVWPSSVNH